MSGVALASFFETAVRTTADLSLENLLAEFGIELQMRAAEGPQDQGGVKKQSELVRRASLGFTFKASTLGLELSSVRDAGPAEAAGLSAGDQLIAVDGYRVDGRSLLRRLSRHEPGETITVAYFRRNELRTSELTLEAAPLDTCGLSVVASPDARALSLRQDWLGS